MKTTAAPVVAPQRTVRAALNSSAYVDGVFHTVYEAHARQSGTRPSVSIRAWVPGSVVAVWSTPADADLVQAMVEAAHDLAGLNR